MEVETVSSKLHLPSFLQQDTGILFPAIAAIGCFGLLIYNAPSIYSFFSKKFSLWETSFTKADVLPINLPSSKITIVNFDLTKERTALRKKINNLSLLKEKDCFYQGDLSEEKSLLTNKLAFHSDLIDYIRRSKGEEKKAALGILVTLIGIKPSFIIEKNELPQELKKILKNKSSFVTIKEFTTTPIKNHLEKKGILYSEKFSFISIDRFCITNENPLKSFDPRVFLHPLQTNKDLSLSAATLYCFTAQGLSTTDQMLSYLLGFGPSWEAYQSGCNEKHEPTKSIFLNAHYEQLGRVFTKKDPLKIGYVFHLSPDFFKKPESPHPFISSLLNATNTHQIFNEISARTEYFQKSYTLKKWLLETYFSNSQA